MNASSAGAVTLLRAGAETLGRSAMHNALAVTGNLRTAESEGLTSVKLVDLIVERIKPA